MISLLFGQRDEKASRALFNKVIGHNGLPKKVMIEKSGASAHFRGVGLLGVDHFALKQNIEAAIDNACITGFRRCS
ncbi:hypothetical protein BIT28_23135 [Photobacterium proteolyticum]|uniref:Uncharacterized protein n=1 Tax=Photobacterium proteolyticum TaxID=1903952 RepID=A0A1Q9GLT7_9GAMM|nr:hypothetical protein BIT28_23135 [Photobacterium proteolyticum]